MNTILFFVIFALILLLISFILSRLLIFTIRIFFKILPAKIKIINVTTTIIFFVLFVLYVLYNPAKNYKTAYIEKYKNHYIITTIGKRNLMVHDPISLLQKGTYIDSAKFTIPKPLGIIKGKYLPNEPTSYPTINNDAIIINGNTLEINLIYYNFDDKVNKPNVWNGKYKLVKRNF